VRVLRAGMGSLAAALLVTLFLPTVAAGAATNIVADGNFATPAVASNSGFVEFCVAPTAECPTASTTFGPWTVTAGSVDVAEAALFSPPAGDPTGTQSVDLDGENPGTIAQKLTVTSGTMYTGTLELSANPSCGASDKTLNVLINGAGIANYTYAATESPFGPPNWIPETFHWTASGSSAVLSFQSTDPAQSGCGPLLTDITAMPVAGTPLLNPLVGAVALVVLALAGGVVYFRRRRRESATA
jgi:hypothetical protein